MRKVILFIAISLDGYIADKSGSVHWLSGDGSDPENMGTYGDFINTIDTVVLGYSTYNQIITELSPTKWAYEGMKSYVITHREIKSENNEIIITSQTPEELIRELKQQEGKDIWICGGASIANQLIKHRLIDRFQINIMPTILGGGIKLFESQEEETQLKLIETISYNGIIDSIYELR